MMILRKSTKKILKGIRAGVVCLLLALFFSGYGLTVSIADQAPEVPAAVTPPDSRPKGEPVSKSKNGQAVDPPGEDVQLPSVLPRKSTGYPSFYGGRDAMKGRIRGLERDLGQSTRSLNDSVRRMNDAVNRMRYVPKRF